MLPPYSEYHNPNKTTKGEKRYYDRKYKKIQRHVRGGEFNPDDMFDPTTHIATEENFIQLLEHEVYDRKYIGYGVTLSNSAAYNNGVWIIADVDHDSENTGQTNCYDLINRDCVVPDSFYGQSYNYRNSYVRTWLLSTFYPGFSSDFKARTNNIKYQYMGTWYNDDNMVIPSFIEVNGTTGTTSTNYRSDDGNTPYPIFTDNNSRIKKYENSAVYWWTRSYNTAAPRYLWIVRYSGDLYNGNSGYYGASNYVASILRVS